MSNRKPIDRHIAEGTMQKCRHGTKETIVKVGKLPKKPPERLSTYGKEAWIYHFPIVNGCGILTEADLGVFTFFCEAMGLAHEAALRMRDAGTIWEPLKADTDDGRKAGEPSRHRSNWYIQYTENMLNATRLASALGLTPVDRGRVLKAEPIVASEKKNVAPRTGLDQFGPIGIVGGGS